MITLFVVQGGLIYLDKPVNGAVAAYEDGFTLLELAEGLSRSRPGSEKVGRAHSSRATFNGVNWEALGAIANLLAVIGVIATLIYFVDQDSTKQ